MFNLFYLFQVYVLYCIGSYVTKSLQQKVCEQTDDFDILTQRMKEGYFTIYMYIRITYLPTVQSKQKKKHLVHIHNRTLKETTIMSNTVNQYTYTRTQDNFPTVEAGVSWYFLRAGFYMLRHIESSYCVTVSQCVKESQVQDMNMKFIYLKTLNSST